MPITLSAPTVKRGLFISALCPSDFSTAVHGVFSRMTMLLEALQAHCEELEILFFIPPDPRFSALDAVGIEADLQRHWNVKAQVSLCRKEPMAHDGYANYFAPIFGVARNPEYASLLGKAQIAAYEACLARSPNLILAHRLPAMLLTLHATQRPPATVLDLDDIEHIKFFRGIRMPPIWKAKLLYYLQVPALALAELRAVARATKTLVCSKQDQAYLEKMSCTKRVTTIPNSVTMPLLSDDAAIASRQPTLVFVGYFGYQPNIQAAEFLLSQIWPRIRAALPAARLKVVGREPDNISSYAIPPAGVEFTGFVADLASVYDDATVVCCPVLTGSGTRVKIIEAAAYAKAIVSTTIGAEGLELRDGEEILLRDTAESFAAACVQLLSDAEYCNSMGNAARRAAESRYDRVNILQMIRRELESCSTPYL